MKLSGQLTPVWALIPHSKATNSDQLIDELCELVEKEPRRLFMDQFTSRYVPEDNEDIKRGPACGFIGCYAGWVVALKATGPDDLQNTVGDADIEERAYRYFPSSLKTELVHLFWGHDDYEFPSKYIWGTQEYADQAVANLRKFQERHKSELRAFQLSPTIVKR